MDYPTYNVRPPDLPGSMICPNCDEAFRATDKGRCPFCLTALYHCPLCEKIVTDVFTSRGVTIHRCGGMPPEYEKVTPL
jgi:hypothetical protein